MTTSSMTIESLFGYADIDDITEEDECTVLVFTIRDGNAGGSTFEVKGESLDDCLDQAHRILKRERTLSDLRREGLTDDDIDRLADIKADEVADFASQLDEVWYRGFIAGAQETADLLTETSFFAPAQQAPAMAAAGEPVSVTNLERELPDDVLAALAGKEIPLTLALLMPGKIVIG